MYDGATINAKLMAVTDFGINVYKDVTVTLEVTCFEETLTLIEPGRVDIYTEKDKETTETYQGMVYFQNSDDINCPATLSLLAEDGES